MVKFYEKNFLDVDIRLYMAPEMNAIGKKFVH